MQLRDLRKAPVHPSWHVVTPGWGGTAPPAWTFTFLLQPACHLTAFLSWGWSTRVGYKRRTNRHAVSALVWLGNFVAARNLEYGCSFALSDDDALAVMQADPWEFFYAFLDDFAIARSDP